MGRINNEHLAKLWDFMVFYNVNSDDHHGDVLKAFQECDEALSELDDQCEHWKIMYANACGDQDVLKESIRLLDTENRSLKQKVHDQEKEIMQRRKEADGLYKELDRLRDEKGSLSYQKIRDQEKEINQLREENEDLKKRCKDLLKHNVDVITVNNKTIDRLRKDNEKLGNTLQDLQKEHDELKKDCAYMTNSRDTWRTRAKHAEAEVEELKKKLDLVQHAYNGASKDRDSKAEAVVKLANKRDQLQEALDNIRAELEAKVKRMDEITNDRDTYNSLYDELKKDYVKLSEENKRLNARTDCLREEVKWYRKHYKEQSDKIRELQAADIRKYSWHGDGNTITLTMSEANRKAILKLLFNTAFGAPQEYKRDFLKEFCDDHCFCQGCPLRFSDCDFDNMSDEEIEKCYKMAISST